MEISIDDPQLQRFVAEEVRSGQYANPQEVVSEALLTLRDQEAEPKAGEFTPEHEAYLRRKLQTGLEQLDRGEGTRVENQDQRQQLLDTIESHGKKLLAAITRSPSFCFLPADCGWD